MLLAVEIEPLTEVALIVVEPDRHERNVEVGRRLDVIAGEDAQAARVDRDRLVEAEFRREIRDRPRPQHARVARAPGVRRGQVFLHAPVGVIDAAVQHELRRALFQRVDGNLLEQRHRIVADLAPEHRVDVAEQADRGFVPAPPEIARERRQPLMRGRDELPQRARFADDRGELGAGGHQHADDVLGEDARFLRLHDQHALQQAAVDHRDAEERVIRVFAGFIEILEARMPRGVFDDQRAELFADQSGEAFGEAHPDVADALGAEADGGGEHQRGAVRFQQIHGADVGREPALDQLDDVGQRLGGVAALRDEMADLFEGPEEGSLLGGRRGRFTHSSYSCWNVQA